MDYARTILDELMGPDRNLDVKIQKNFYDENVCKHYLVEYCPNDLFINTKSDLGVCGKIHDDRLKAQFQELPEEEKANFDYEAKFFWRVRGLIRDLDWKLRDANRRLELKGDENLEKQQQILRDERMEKIVIVEEKIKELQEQIERCGEEGLVDEARELNEQVEALNIQLISLKTEESREKRMEACLICGSLLVVNDSPERVAAHLAGKQHSGFQKLRETYELLKDKYEHLKDELRSSHHGGGAGGGGGGGQRNRREFRPERRHEDQRSGGYGGGGGYGDRQDDRPRHDRDGHRGGSDRDNDRGGRDFRGGGGGGDRRDDYQRRDYGRRDDRDDRRSNDRHGGDRREYQNRREQSPRGRRY